MSIKDYSQGNRDKVSARYYSYLLGKARTVTIGMKVTRVAVAERNYLRGILRAFLLGKKNQNYVVGCFRNVPIKIYDEIARDLAEFQNQPRFHELYEIRKRLMDALSTNPSRSRWSPWVISRY